MKYNIRLCPTYVKSEENTFADALSRLLYTSKVTDFELKLKEFDLCCFSDLITTLHSRFGSARSEDDPF